jgi:hypothetical protein
MAVTVKQGIIPSIENFTTNYDYNLVHANNLQKSVLRNQN